MITTYDRPSDDKSFSNHERLNLTLAALARNDQEEMKLLVRTTPIRYYYSADKAYTNRLDAITIIGMHFSELVAFHYNKILFLTAIQAIAEHAPTISEKLFDAEKNANDVLIGLLSNIASLKSVYGALIDFCNHIEINYENILKVEKIKGKYSDMDEYLSMKVEENKVYRQHIKNQFCEYWNAYDYNTTREHLQ